VNRPYTKNSKLDDCRRHGPHSGAELFLVEGDSAANGVTAARDKLFQAVLPMQGKPMNVTKASTKRLAGNIWLQTLFNTLGCGVGRDFNINALRYERVMLLFDPDADGIHCGALMLICFERLMPELIDSGRVHMIRPPLLRVTSPSLPAPVYAHAPTHQPEILRALQERGIVDYQILRYRGLGSLERELLIEQCILPETRRTKAVTRDEAQLAMKMFGGAN
jgi:DNA gyrase/topoisomerase IV subunit B